MATRGTARLAIKITSELKHALDERAKAGEGWERCALRLLLEYFDSRPDLPPESGGVWVHGPLPPVKKKAGELRPHRLEIQVPPIPQS